MKRKIFIITVFIELVIIFALGIKMYYISENVLGEEVSVNIIPRDNVDFPKDSKLKYFYEPKQNSMDNEKPKWLPDGYDYKITINSDSLNERFDYSTNKPQDVFRIIAIGNSRTYGAYVNTEENYPERLEDLLNKELNCKNIKQFEVINLGVGGYDIEYSVERYKIRGQKYNPDLILWHLKNGDFSIINEIMKPKIDLYREQIQADKSLLNNFYEKGEFHPWTDKVRQELAEEFKKQGGLKYQKAVLHNMDFYKSKLVFVLFSTGRLLLNNEDMNILRDFAKLRSETYIFDGLTSDYDHFADGHPNAKGYEQIAGQIFNHIKSNHLIPCT